MPITTAMCNSYKKELMEAQHNHLLAGGHLFKMALYLNPVAEMGAGTTQYTNVDEASGTNYTGGGADLTNIDPALDGAAAHTQFQNAVWANSSISASGCMIWNTNIGGNGQSVSLHDFGQTFISDAGDFTVVMPTNDGTTGLLRLV